MSQTTDAYVEAAVRRFDEALNRARFQTVKCGDAPEDWEWSGKVGKNPEPVTISLTNDFPFAAPRVVLTQRVDEINWHQMPDGSLCLWNAHSLGGQPWLDGDGLLARVEEWIAYAEAGWPDDMPQLDLEAYNNLWLEVRDGQWFTPILAIDDWEQIAGGWFRTTPPDKNGLLTVTSAQLSEPVMPVPQRNKKKRRAGLSPQNRSNKFLNGIAIDLGKVTKPFIFTEQLAKEAGANSPLIVAMLETRRPVLFAARYTRDEAVGFIGFWFESTRDGITRRCFPVAERRYAQQRRAGWHAATLSNRKVSVIGAGSIGSHLVDLLHRSGVNDLTIHDFDVLLPGNLTRHAASPAFVGASKTTAVRETANLRTPEHPIKTSTSVRGLNEAVQLLRDQDLVVDCTGDRLTWQLLLAAAEVTGRSFLHVAVIGHGQVGRVDICPPLEGTDPLAESVIQPLAATEWEAGCGDPVSPTPPTAVAETAAMGARFAIRMLTGDSVLPAGESRELFPVVP
ncbi:ThiF family adenylyltransferase [Glutamicibacter creatinolyticus]|uniref:ThiF family adenylyltransferase n=1 Tax=Glutamicibacter creatinolyticus TaxID=162496 RepID=UPI0033E7EDE8